MIIESKYFSNVGKKIKTMAKIWFIIGIIGGIVGFFSMIALSMDERHGGGGFVAIGFIILIVQFFISWGISLLIYGFGELVDSVNYSGFSPARTTTAYYGASLHHIDDDE